jgi:hypothetical protein
MKRKTAEESIEGLNKDSPPQLDIKHPLHHFVLLLFG